MSMSMPAVIMRGTSSHLKRLSARKPSSRQQYIAINTYSKQDFASGITVKDFSSLPARKRRSSKRSFDDKDDQATMMPLGFSDRRRKRRRFRRRVRFNDSVVSHPCPPNFEDQPQSVFWETPEDLQEMKRSAKNLSASIASHSLIPYRHFSYTNVMDRIYRHAISKSPLMSTPIRDDRIGLYTWVSVGHSRRGLERWSIPSVGRHKKIQRKLQVNHLLNVQRAFPDVSARTLRKVSEVFSIAATLHALAMGKADEKAAMTIYRGKTL